MNWHKVLCTHEERQTLAQGDWLGDNFPGIALPSSLALGMWVYVRYNGPWTLAQCVDVGPWATDDVEYVLGDEVPRAETFKGKPCPTRLGGEATATIPDGKGGWICAPISNGAGIDLFPRVAKQLGIKIGDNVTVQWRFVDDPSTIE